MRERAIAAIAAALIIVVAFVGRGALFGDDDDADDDTTSTRSGATGLICPNEFADICRAIDPDARMEAAGATADRLIGARSADELDGRVWVVPKAWADLVIASRQFNREPALFTSTDPLASTRVVLPVWDGVTDALGCGDDHWRCVTVDRAGEPIPGSANRVRVGAPPIDTALGLPAAATRAVMTLGDTDFDARDLTAVPASGLTQHADAFSDMRSRGPGAWSAVLVAEAQITRLTSSFGTIVVADPPTPPPRVDLVLVTAEDGSTSSDLLRAVTAGFGDDGWDPPGTGGDGMPDGDLLAAIRGQWSR